MKANVEAIVTETLDGLEYDLVEWLPRGSKQRPILDVRIDRRDGTKVTVADCARASRALEARFDAGTFAGIKYVLEVSSPGMERPLKSVADWRRFTGRQAAVNSATLGGRLEVTIVGIDGEPGAEVATLRDARGDHLVAIADVQDARLAFHWTR